MSWLREKSTRYQVEFQVGQALDGSPRTEVYTLRVGYDHHSRPEVAWERPAPHPEPSPDQMRQIVVSLVNQQRLQVTDLLALPTTFLHDWLAPPSQQPRIAVAQSMPTVPVNGRVR